MILTQANSQFDILIVMIIINIKLAKISKSNSYVISVKDQFQVKLISSGLQNLNVFFAALNAGPLIRKSTGEELNHLPGVMKIN